MALSDAIKMAILANIPMGGSKASFDPVTKKVTQQPDPSLPKLSGINDVVDSISKGVAAAITQVLASGTCTISTAPLVGAVAGVVSTTPVLNVPVVIKVP